MIVNLIRIAGFYHECTSKVRALDTIPMTIGASSQSLDLKEIRSLLSTMLLIRIRYLTCYRTCTQVPRRITPRFLRCRLYAHKMRRIGSLKSYNDFVSKIVAPKCPGKFINCTQPSCCHGRTSAGPTSAPSVVRTDYS